MKKKNKQILKAVKWITKGEVEIVHSQWPPFCSGILHQPKRPIECKENEQ